MTLGSRLSGSAGRPSPEKTDPSPVHCPPSATPGLARSSQAYLGGKTGLPSPRGLDPARPRLSALGRALHTLFGGRHPPPGSAAGAGGHCELTASPSLQPAPCPCTNSTPWWRRDEDDQVPKYTVL